MFALLRNRLLPLTAAVLAAVGSAGAAEAGWVTIKNDTNRVVVIQETTDCNGGTKRGRPVRLLPGESFREFHPAGCVKVEVFDGQNQSKLLHSGNVSITPKDQAFSVSTDGRTVSVIPTAPRPGR